MRNSRRLIQILAAAAAVLLAVPTLANASTIGLSGVINGGFTFGDPGFEQGDSVNATLDVDLNPDNSFARGDLNVFDLSVGSLAFSLGASDFVNFGGSLSSDGATVTALNFLSNFVTASGGPTGSTYNLAYDIDNPPFAITAVGPDPAAGNGIGEAMLTANVGSVAVAEPDEMLLFAFALAWLGLGVAVRGRRRGGSSPV